MRRPAATCCCTPHLLLCGSSNGLTARGTRSRPLANLARTFLTASHRMASGLPQPALAERLTFGFWRQGAVWPPVSLRAAEFTSCPSGPPIGGRFYSLAAPRLTYFASVQTAL